MLAATCAIGALGVEPAAARGNRDAVTINVRVDYGRARGPVLPAGISTRADCTYLDSSGGKLYTVRAGPPGLGGRLVLPTSAVGATMLVRMAPIDAMSHVVAGSCRVSTVRPGRPADRHDDRAGPRARRRVERDRGLEPERLSVTDMRDRAFLSVVAFVQVAPAAIC